MNKDYKRKIKNNNKIQKKKTVIKLNGIIQIGKFSVTWIGTSHLPLIHINGRLTFLSRF